MTLAAWGVPTTLERGAKSEVAHKWARRLRNPCRLGGPHRFTARGFSSSSAFAPRSKAVWTPPEAGVT